MGTSTAHFKCLVRATVPLQGYLSVAKSLKAGEATGAGECGRRPGIIVSIRDKSYHVVPQLQDRSAECYPLVCNQEGRAGHRCET